MAATTQQILFVALAREGLDFSGELASILGAGCEVTALRGADRQKIAMALDGRTQFDVIHVAGHGSTSVLGAEDGLLPEPELVSMLEGQRAVHLVIVSACDSYELVGAIHNALHVPCIGYNAPIEDRAAVEFSRSFYRAWRRSGDIRQAMERGRESLAILYPSEAQKIRMINGDMVTPAAWSQCISQVRGELTTINGRLGGIEQRLDRIEGVPRRWVISIVLLVVLLIVAQIATPFLNAALIH